MGKVFERKEIDNIGVRYGNVDSYKNRSFGNKRTMIDEYTGKKIYYSSDNHFTTQRTSNIDHIVPLDKLAKRYSGEISQEQLRRIANSDYNLAVTNETLNKSKSNLNNHEFLLRQLKQGDVYDVCTSYNMLQKQVTAEANIFTDVTLSKLDNNIKKLGFSSTNRVDLKNVGLKATDAGTQSAFITLTISSLNNLAMVANGEKNITEALQEIGTDTVGSFASAAGVSMLQDATASVVKHYGNQELLDFVGQNLPIAELTMLYMVGKSVTKFASGEISGEECAREIVLNGAGVMAFKLGMAFGGPAGAIISTLVVSQISRTILEYQQQRRLDAKRIAMFNHIVSDAMVAIEKQREKIKYIADCEKEKLAKAFEDGIDCIELAIFNNNIEGIIIGLDCILSVFNAECKFKNMDDFNDFFDNPNAILTL